MNAINGKFEAKYTKNKSLKNGKSKRGNEARHGTIEKNENNNMVQHDTSKSSDIFIAKTTPKTTSPKSRKRFRSNKTSILLRKLGRKFLILGLMSGTVYLAILLKSKYDAPSTSQRSTTPADDAVGRIFAQADTFVQRRAFEVPCSQDYENDRYNWHDCLPKRCGRVVMDSLITREETEALLRIAQKGLALGGSNGGASILDLHSGALSKGDSIINLFRLPQARSVFTPDDFIVFSQVRNKIQLRIAAEFGSTQQKLFLTHPTFFSRLTNKTAKTIHDEYWHPHVDKKTYETFHYTSLLYLDTYEVNFTGGRFVFVDQDTKMTVVEPRMGRVSMFTSGSENLHFVEKVTSGERHAATIAFTCDRKSAIHDVAATATSSQRRS